MARIGIVVRVRNMLDAKDDQYLFLLHLKKKKCTTVSPVSADVVAHPKSKLQRMPRVANTIRPQTIVAEDMNLCRLCTSTFYESAERKRGKEITENILCSVERDGFALANAPYDIYTWH